jgi:hypothetical protein
MKDKIKDFIMWAISEGHMEYDGLLAMPENINTDEDVADRLVEMYFDYDDMPEYVNDSKSNQVEPEQDDYPKFPLGKKIGTIVGQFVPEPPKVNKCNCWTDRMTTTSTWDDDAGCLVCDNCGKKEL